MKRMKRPWFYGYSKLLKIQKAIHQSKKKNIRLCRNYQRLLHRNSFVQLLIINEILKEDNLNFLEIRFDSKKYRQFFKQDMIVRLWIFALSPILDNKRSLTYFQANEIYEIFYLYLKKPFVESVFFCKFSNFFSKKNKYWIISNISVEKKFFLNEVFNKNKSSKKIFSLKKIFKQLVIFHLQVNLKHQKQFPISKFYYSAKKNFCLLNNNRLSNLEIFEYNTIVIFFLKQEFQGIYLDPRMYGLKFQFYKFCFLKNGIDFLGWFFKKNKNYLKVRASRKNFYNYKKELNKCFKKNQPLDKIISNIRMKILNWRKWYTRTKIPRNNYFFWQIWYWLKKRHRKKSVKWLYSYYWEKSTSKKWILSVNKKIFIFSQEKEKTR
nr:Group II intron, maturase [Rhipidosiphon lewmanomontiae]